MVKAAKAVSGSITRNIAEMHRMVIEELLTSLVAMLVNSRAVAVALAAVVESAVPAVQVALVELAVQEAPGELAAQVASAALVVQGAQVVLEA